MELKILDKTIAYYSGWDKKTISQIRRIISHLMETDATGKKYFKLASKGCKILDSEGLPDATIKISNFGVAFFCVIYGHTWDKTVDQVIKIIQSLRAGKYSDAVFAFALAGVIFASGPYGLAALSAIQALSKLNSAYHLYQSSKGLDDMEALALLLQAEPELILAVDRAEVLYLRQFGKRLTQDVLDGFIQKPTKMESKAGGISFSPVSAITKPLAQGMPRIMRTEEKTFDLSQWLCRHGYSDVLYGLYVGSMENCLVKDVTFDQCIFANDVRKCTFIRAHIKRCDLSQVTWKKTQIIDVRIEETRLYSSMFINCLLKNVGFFQSDIKNTYFLHSALDHTSFLASTITHSIFNGSWLNEVIFFDSDLIESSLFCACPFKCAFVGGRVLNMAWGGNERAFAMSPLEVVKDKPIIAYPTDLERPPEWGEAPISALRKAGAVVMPLQSSVPYSKLQNLADEIKPHLEEILFDDSCDTPVIKQLYEKTSEDCPGLQTIKETASKAIEYSDGLFIHGGRDVGRWMYREWDESGLYDYDTGDYITQKTIDGYGMDVDLYEGFSAVALTNAGKPGMAECRGMQLFNVVKGGTLKDTEEDGNHNGWQYLRVTQVMYEKFPFLKGQTHLLTHSAHFQQCDQLGDGFKVILDQRGIPKMIIGNNILAFQFHPSDHEDLRRKKMPPPMAKQLANNQEFYNWFVERAHRSL